MRTLTLLGTIFFLANLSLAQVNKIEENIPDIHINYITEDITLDGSLEEPIWQRLQSATNFAQYFPSDTTSADGQTEIYMCYDDEFLYVAAVCYSSDNDFVVRSMKRDYGFGQNDNVSLIFDTFNDNTNAFLFGINAIGARREALISGGGRNRRNFDPSWDNKWYGDAQIYEDENKWIGEVAIPFKAIRFNENNAYWRFNCYRQDLQNAEITSYVNIPRNYVLMNMNYMGKMVWEKPLEKQGTNISVIPYVSANVNRDFEDVLESKTQSSFGVGGDVKVGITSGLNLDLTVNPDFSQVEVDQQVTNLDRFEIFFPERRQFFQENADLFGGFGSSQMNPFFSRRIGIALDTASGLNIQNQVFYGARLTGKINDNLRIGILNMQTASDDKNDLPSFNYSVVSLEQKVSQKSSVAFLGLNKQAFNSESFAGSYDSYNRLIGTEYRFASKSELFNGKISYLHALSESEKSNNYAHLAQFNYNSRAIGVEWEHNLIGNGFDAELGFIPRKDILRINPLFVYRLYPENKKISRYEIGVSMNSFYKLGNDESSIVTSFKNVDNTYRLFMSGSFQDNGRFNINLRYFDIFLLNDFDPTRVQEDDVFLSAGTSHQYIAFDASYNSNNRSKLTYRINPQFGQFFNGFRYGSSVRLDYRIKAYGTVGINVNYNKIELDAPFVPVDLWLIGPQFDLSFSKEIFFRTFIQYNNQSENLNINARFQWRYSPASDLFIVYTDNYLVDSISQLEKRNRALVLKLTYWLNI